MADDLITSLYPPPPPYYKFFTKPNIEKFESLKLSNDLGSATGALKFQIPPEVPLTSQYRGYGSVWSLDNKIPSLKSLGFAQLYQDEDETITSKTKIAELHKLLDSLLLNFLELVGSVAVEPAKFYIKIEHLKRLIINMNHLLNTYRPHQTRESLIMLLQKLIEDKRAETAQIKKAILQAKQDILELAQRSTGDSLASEIESALVEGSQDDTNEELQALIKLLEGV